MAPPAATITADWFERLSQEPFIRQFRAKVELLFCIQLASLRAYGSAAALRPAVVRSGRCAKGCAGALRFAPVAVEEEPRVVSNRRRSRLSQRARVVAGGRKRP